MCARTVRRHLKHNAGYTLIELLLTCLVLLILTAVIAPTAWYYINKADARAVLTEAKTARLAAYVTSLDCYANVREKSISCSTVRRPARSGAWLTGRNPLWRYILWMRTGSIGMYTRQII